MTKRCPGKRRGFTLVEVLVSMTIFAVLLTMIVGVMNSVTSIHKNSRADAQRFQSARNAFEMIKRSLSGATLQTYYDYIYPNDDSSKPPLRYARMSDLHFVCAPASEIVETSNGETAGHAVFFQVPSGIVDSAKYRGHEMLLNVVGFYVEFSEGTEYAPKIADETDQSTRYQARLIQAVQPSEDNSIFVSTSRDQRNSRYDRQWIEGVRLEGDDSGKLDKHVVANGVIALILRPRLAEAEEGSSGDPTRIAPKFAYDSRHWEETDSPLAELTRNQLPPIVEVTLVAVDEISVQRLGATGRKLDPETLELDKLFKNASDGSFEEDLARFGETLEQLNIDYRVFRGNVLMTNARWNGDPT